MHSYPPPNHLAQPQQWNNYAAYPPNYEPLLSHHNQQPSAYFQPDLNPQPSPQPIHQMSKDDHLPLPPTTRRKKRYCCCFNRRRSCCRCFFITFFFLLIALGLAVFFLFPRIPEITSTPPFVPSNLSPVEISGQPIGATAENPFKLTMNVAVNLTVISKNYIDWDISLIDVDASILDDQGKPIPSLAGKGKITNSVFRKMANTTVTLPMALSYTLAGPLSNVANDPALSTIITTCGMDGSGKKQFRIRYTVTATATLVSWTGYKPSVTREDSLLCPIPDGQMKQVSDAIERVKASISSAVSN